MFIISTIPELVTWRNNRWTNDAYLCNPQKCYTNYCADCIGSYTATRLINGHTSPETVLKMLAQYQLRLPELFDDIDLSPLQNKLKRAQLLNITILE